MNITIAPGPRTGSIRVPASKSQAHRLLICAALGTHPVRLRPASPNARLHRLTGSFSPTA